MAGVSIDKPPCPANINERNKSGYVSHRFANIASSLLNVRSGEQ